MATSTPPAGTSQTSAVTLTVTDAPPAGVTVLSFEVTVNSAVLNPGNVQLITNPQRIEVKQLETDSAFLSTMNVPAGTYQSITVNVTNPELTVMNNSGAAIGNCANNSVCHLEPAAAGNVTFSSAPFPVVLAGGSPTGFQVDLNVANMISGTLGVDFNAQRCDQRRAASAGRTAEQQRSASMTWTICWARRKSRRYRFTVHAAHDERRFLDSGEREYAIRVGRLRCR